MQKFISSSVFKNFKDAVNLASELNMGLEISRLAPDLEDIDETFDERVSQMKEDLRDFKGELNLHAFFIDLPPVSADPLIREVSKKRYYQSLNAAKYLGATTVVFHTGYNASLKFSDYYIYFKEEFIVFWKEFIKEFEEAGITAVLENVEEYSPEFILDVINKVDSPNLKTSIDIGHANLHSQIAVSDWIKAYGKNLYHMHIHNNYGDDDTHSALEDGSINVEETFKTLFELDLKPKIVFEIFKKDALIRSIEYLKKIEETLTTLTAGVKNDY